jgi:hypothetical protein
MKTVCGIVLGALITATSVVAQQPGSQRALNGFVLGQHKETVANTFDELLQEGTTPSGQTYQAFGFDREHQAYMLFQYSQDNPDYLYSIQLTGDPGTNTRPFLGLQLGDSRAKVLARLGNPVSVTQNPELHLEQLEYGPERNFSVEVDSLGQLFSIRIIGYNGFGNQPEPEDLPTLAQVKELVAGTDIDALLDLLAGDVEVFRGNSVYSYRRAARLDLADNTSRMARELFSGPGSLREALTAEVIRGAEFTVRVYEDSSRYPGLLYTFSDNGPLAEMLFTAEAGAWRLWEIKFN